MLAGGDFPPQRKIQPLALDPAYLNIMDLGRSSGAKRLETPLIKNHMWDMLKCKLWELHILWEI